MVLYVYNEKIFLNNYLLTKFQKYNLPFFKTRFISLKDLSISVKFLIPKLVTASK